MSYIVTKVVKNHVILKEFNDELVQSECGEYSSFAEVQAKRGALVLLKKPANWKPGDKQVRVEDHRTEKNNKGELVFKVGEKAKISLTITDTKIFNMKKGVNYDNLYRVVVG